MAYDTLVWGEEQAANGLTLTASKGPESYVYAADYIRLKKGRGDPILFALGSVSDTKPAGSAVIPEFSNENTYIYGGGGMDFARYFRSENDLRGLGGIKLQAGESLTGYLSNTNVAEGGVLACNVAYGKLPTAYNPLVARSFKRILKEKFTITSAAAVTYNSGAVALSSGLTRTNFLNDKSNYLLLGVEGCIGAATFGGICHATGLSAPGWPGHFPGVAINPLSAVTFSTDQPFTEFAEPLPVSGSEFDTVKLGMTATSAGAMLFTLVLAEL